MLKNEMKLKQEIYDLAKELGATISSGQKVHKDLINAPEIIIEYSTSFNWPARKEFQSELIDEYMGSVYIGGDVYSLPKD